MRLYTWNGEQMGLKRICELEDVAYSTTAHLLRYGEHSIEEAVEIAKSIRTHRMTVYNWNGTAYTNLSKLAKAAGICGKTLRKYMSDGGTIDEAVKAAQRAKANPAECWRMSVLAAKKEKERRDQASDVEKAFLYIMGTCKTEEFNFRRVSKNEYVWQGDALIHRLTVHRGGSEYIARFKSNDAIACRRTIV